MTTFNTSPKKVKHIPSVKREVDSQEIIVVEVTFSHIFDPNLTNNLSNINHAILLRITRVTAVPYMFYRMHTFQLL